MPHRTIDPFAYIGRRLIVVRMLAPQRRQRGALKKAYCAVSLLSTQKGRQAIISFFQS
jgi:hypothetical protein